MKTSTHTTELLPSTQLRKAVCGGTHQIILLLALLLGLGSAFAHANTLLMTFTNPVPSSSLFGVSVAAMGNKQVLIGSDGGERSVVYLFSTSGALLTTFTNPIAGGYGGFGSAVAAVGSDRVIVGAYDYFAGGAQVGRAFLFNTNGTLLTTFTNPSPATVQAFGWSVNGFGSDRVMIGTAGNVAYLFRTNGALLTTFTNPITGPGGGFGLWLAVVGNDRVLIGAPYENTGANGAGAAYLFQTNGTLLMTFTNPVPASGDNFGTAMAAVGSDRLLISAIDYGGAKGNGGSAYLFSTNGTLLTTFTNPTPAAFDYFGWSVAAVGSSRVLIGAYQDSTGAFRAGSTYLFSTNGALLTTFTNPAPVAFGSFGGTVAAVGSDLVLVGAWGNGAASLFALPYPPLGIARNGSAVSLKWTTPETGFALQQTDALGTATVWDDTTNSVSITGQTNVVQQTLVTTNRFFRLHRP